MAFITKHQLKVNRLINTHCHIDHVLGKCMGQQTVRRVYPEAHRGEIPVESCRKGGSDVRHSLYILHPPSPSFLQEGDTITLGNQIPGSFVLSGHSPASILPLLGMENYSLQAMYCFTEAPTEQICAGGNYDTLIESIETKLMSLPDDVMVYFGHGIPTNIGDERRFNPFSLKIKAHHVNPHPQPNSFIIWLLKLAYC